MARFTKAGPRFRRLWPGATVSPHGRTSKSYALWLTYANRFDTATRLGPRWGGQTEKGARRRPFLGRGTIRYATGEPFRVIRINFLVGELSPGKSCGGTRNLAARVGRLSLSAPTMIQEIGFALDSPLEGTGFEPLQRGVSDKPQKRRVMPARWANS
jgi:hypothetical protein